MDVGDRITADCPLLPRQAVLGNLEHLFPPLDADPARRLVREIDGRPALEVYAAACGFRKRPREGLDFAPFPLMIRIGGQYYPRGMQRIYADGTLEFACALEPGLVVALGKPGNMIARLDELLSAMRAQIGAPELIIGFDCAARTAYMEREGLTLGIETLTRPHAVTGFASLAVVAVAGLIPGLHRRSDPRTSAAQVLLISLGIVVIALAERLTHR